MSDFRAADHAMGLELQIEELEERRERAAVQGQPEEARQLAAQVEDLQAELAITAETVARNAPAPPPAPELHDADQLNLGADPD